MFKVPLTFMNKTGINKHCCWKIFQHILCKRDILAHDVAWADAFVLRGVCRASRAVRGQVGRTLQLCNSLQWSWEGRFPPSVNNAVAWLLREVGTQAWKAAPQLEPRVSFQLLGGKRLVGLGAQAVECTQVFANIC